MDTVLGLAITPSTIGWVMAEGGGSGGPAVAGDEMSAAGGDTEPDAAQLAATASAVATRVRTMLTSRGERLHGVAVTWSDEAAVGAALLLESLADDGFEHVVPVRYGHAVASLADGIGDRGDRTAVCVVEPAVATLVLLDQHAGPDPIVTACPISGIDETIGWLGDTLGPSGQRPETLMVAGSLRGMDRLGRRLESLLSVPVFVQGGALQALARGAALALAPHTELSAAPLESTALGAGMANTGRRRRIRSLPYAAAVLMLAGGAATFVASVSAALSLQLGTGREVPQVPAPQHVTVARVAVPAAPPASAPALPPPPAATEAPGEASGEASGEFGSMWDAPGDEAGVPAPEPDGVPSLLDRAREHIFGAPGR